MGDRTARPPYAYENLRVKVNDMAPIVRASWLRGVSALPSSFAHESYVDELATAAGVDPVAFRLRHLRDPRAAELVRETAQKAGWRMRTGPQENADGGLGPGGDVLFGQGFAYARYVHSKWPGFGAAWSAWVADVEVNNNHRRSACAPRGGGARRGADGQPGRRRAPDPRQRDPDHQPGAEGARAVRAAGEPSAARRCRACCRRAWSRAANGAATRSSTSARCR